MVRCPSCTIRRHLQSSYLRIRLPLCPVFHPSVCPPGWEFETSGKCVKMPSTRTSSVRVKSLPCVEKQGLVWVWPGKGEPDEVFPDTMPPSHYTVHAEVSGGDVLRHTWRPRYSDFSSSYSLSLSLSLIVVKLVQLLLRTD